MFTKVSSVHKLAFLLSPFSKLRLHNRCKHLDTKVGEQKLNKALSLKYEKTVNIYTSTCKNAHAVTNRQIEARDFLFSISEMWFVSSCLIEAAFLYYHF